MLAVIFVFFFLAEYASIILICILTSILFLGGYLIDFSFIKYFFDFFQFILYYIQNYFFLETYNPQDDYVLVYIENLLCNPLIDGLIHGLALGIKSCIMIFIFIWVRASFPRIRFDQLMSFCWTILLPVVIGFIINVPCLLYSFDIIPCNMSLF